MYVCGLCGGEFDRPAVRRWSEPRPDGFRERFRRPACPVCGAGEQYFDKITEGDDAPWENALRRR